MHMKNSWVEQDGTLAALEQVVVMAVMVEAMNIIMT